MEYISGKTVLAAFELLKKQDIPNDGSNAMFIVLILKSLGISRLDNIEKHNILNGTEYAGNLSLLFAPNEASPSGKNDWINPISAGDGIAVSESLSKWMSGRIQNDIFGGATYWRKLIKEESQENRDVNFRFSYDYIKVLLSLTRGKKIDLVALSVWFSRFKKFKSSVSLGNLISFFKEETKLDDDEISTFFSTSSSIDLSFSEEPFDSCIIRKDLTLPKGENDSWFLPGKGNAMSKENASESFVQVESKNISICDLQNILNNYYQVILSGAPGTSKSFLASELGKSYKAVLHIQFHPQYSYQDFIGGYVVEGSDVNFKNGEFVNFVEKASQDQSNKYLVIIDEINRANTSQVFGETIQVLDRESTVLLQLGENKVNFFLPKNLYIIGTMNTTDKSVGNIDLALKRRFIDIYLEPDPDLLLNLCPAENGFISLSDFLRKINKRLILVTKNKDFVIGHAIFLQDFVKNNNGKYIWDYSKFEVLFNYKILPIIEEYCDNNFDQIKVVLGNYLPNRLIGTDFIKALNELMDVE